MYSQEDNMIRDYLNNVSFEDMCRYLGVCWTGLVV